MGLYNKAESSLAFFFRAYQSTIYTNEKTHEKSLKFAHTDLEASSAHAGLVGVLYALAHAEARRVMWRKNNLIEVCFYTAETDET